MSQESAKRLNKYISETGFCSRREADKLIDAGRVTINGKIPEMGTKVFAGDDVCIDHKPVRSKQKPIYIALNKPTGITCTTERDVAGNIVDFIGHHKRIFPIGRLDKPSDGLIFLTNDGDIVNKILRAGNNHEKEYVVRVDKPVTEHFLNKMASGVEILDTVTLPCKVTRETQYSFRITLTQGLNRQIRRMCEALGFEVYKLRRVRIMNISLDGIPNGKWRYLTDAEVAEILRMSEGSSGTEEASKVDGQGQRISKATDAKLYDARQQAEQEKIRHKTYQGYGSDELRHAPNSKRGQGRHSHSERDDSRNSHTRSNNDRRNRYGNRDNNESRNGSRSTRQDNERRNGGRNTDSRNTEQRGNNHRSNDNRNNDNRNSDNRGSDRRNERAQSNNQRPNSTATKREPQTGKSATKRVPGTLRLKK